jgi:hypothetical protein
MTTRERQRKWRYGLSHAKYARLLDLQKHRCAVCSVPFSMLPSSGAAGVNIDHDPACCPVGASRKCGHCVRGLLCHRCNRRVGAYEREVPGSATGGYETLQLIKRYLADPPARRLSRRSVQVRAE